MLKVLYENENALVCVKPHGVLSQSGAEGADGEDMLNIVSGQIGRQAGLIHRLDRPTGGVMVFSKNKKTEGVLSAAVSDKKSCVKEYLAVVSGVPEVERGEMRDYLYRDARAGKSFVISSPRKGAKEAVLSYELLESAAGEEGPLSLVKIRLETGRTHQIRAQFSCRKMPVAGDGKYGSRERIRCPKETTVSPKDMIALFAYRLSVNCSAAKFDVLELPDKDIYPFSVFAAALDNLHR